MAELQPTIDKNTASDTPVPTASPSLSSDPTKRSWDEDELELNEYHLLGANEAPSHARKKRKTAHECFGKGSAMRLLPRHPGLSKTYTHQCTHPLPKETFHKDVFGKLVPFCGAFIKSGYDKKNGRWVSTNSSTHMKIFHPTSIPGSKAEKRKKLSEEKKVDQMFKAGMIGRKTSGIIRYTVSGEVEDLTSVARLYVFGRQRISKSTFDDPYFQTALRGSNKSRKMLTRYQLEKYVRAEFVIFIIFTTYVCKKKKIQSKGNPFAQGLHDGVTLGNHKGYESLGIDIMDPDWDRNLPICVGFARKPKRNDGSFDGTDATVAKLFDHVLELRTGCKLKEILAGMKSDRAATGVARKVDLEDEACLMHDADKLGTSAVGKLLRRDMSKPVGDNGHRPYANPFPEGDDLMKKAKSMGSHYSTGTCHSALMVLRDKAGLESASPETRIKVR